ncbi:amino acid permease, partial [Acetobacter pasteurianus]|nr:amino acid permease [Acetobacter pasteurianus]
KWVKVIDPRIKVPVRATVFAGVASLILGLLVLINGSAGSGALFSLAICSNTLAFGIPILLSLLPYGYKKFQPGPFYFGKVVSTFISAVAVGWSAFIIVLTMFPDMKLVDKNSMNYTVVINVGIWILSLIYYFTWGYKTYSGPKSNLDDEGSDLSSNHQIDMVLAEEKA